MTGSATVAFSSSYVPYGPSFGATGSEVFQYTGKPLDSATGLYYEGARYYDPSIGRFVTQDSVTGRGDDPQSLNRYVYARDNPMRIVDLAGHEWWNPVAALSAAVSTVVGAATNLANAASNAWNSLPPDAQVGIVLGVSVLAVAATGGIDLPAVAAIDASTIGSIGVGTVTAAVASDPAVDDEASYFGVRLLNAVTGEEIDLPGYPKLAADASKVGIGQWGEGIVQKLVSSARYLPSLVKSAGNYFMGDFLDGTTGIDSKVGTSFKPARAQDYADAVTFGRSILNTPLFSRMGSGVITDAKYFLIQNPNSGAMPLSSAIATLTGLGIRYSVYFAEYY